MAGRTTAVLSQPGPERTCSALKTVAVPLALAAMVAGAVAIVAVGRGTGTAEVVGLNLGAFASVCVLLVMAHRCELYISADRRATATGARSMDEQAMLGARPDGSPVALLPLGLPSVATVVGAGVDPATSHFSGARSTN